MSILLLIDPRGEIKATLEQAIADSGITLKVVNSPHAAKLSLLEFLPSLVLSPINLNEGEKAGLNFCSQLRDHQSFSEIPVALLSDKVDVEVGDAIKHFGAKAVLPFPVMASELRKLLSGLLPELISAPESVEVRTETKEALNVNQEESKTQEAKNLEPSAEVAKKPVTNDKELMETLIAQNKSQNSATNSSSIVEETSQMNLNHFSENLQYAQRILATVLHNLKTSDLLSVIDMDEVPKAVIEMTKSVCEISDSELSMDKEKTHKTASIQTKQQLADQLKA